VKRYDASEIIVEKPDQGDGQGAAGVQCGCLRIRSAAEQEGDRESPVGEIVYELKDFDIDVHGYDPLLAPAEIERFEAKPVASLKGLDGWWIVSSLTLLRAPCWADAGEGAFDLQWEADHRKRARDAYGRIVECGRDAYFVRCRVFSP